MEKKCVKCGDIKPIENFIKWKHSKDGYFNRCKECEKIRRKEIYYSGYNKVMRQKQIDHPEHFKQYNKDYYEKNISKEKERNCEWRQNNKEYNSWRCSFYYHTDINRNIAQRLSGRVRSALKSKKLIKSKKIEDLIGCDISFFKEWFFSLFTTGMTMDNFLSGDIHIDHIIPCDAFDLTKREHQLVCFHYKNLQPMWGDDNISKNNTHNILDINQYVMDYKF